ncbi:MAG: PAS domain S-box protein, partial [Bacteroidia bacterium]|nr:PAS domain S-box protein [Bacteroidia bacterium]
MSQSLGNITDVFERITDAFLALDKNWNCTYINKKAGEILDRIPLQMIGKNLLSEFPEVVGTTFHKAFLECMEEQKYIHLEEFYPPYNKWFEVNFYPSPEGLTVYFRDITERKKAEEVLKENEKFLKIVIDNFPRSFLSVINKELIATFNGGEGFSKLKLDPELFLGKTVQEVFAPYGKAILDTVIIAYEKTFSGEAQVFELFINDQFQLYKTVPLLSGQNEINSILVVVENITEKRLSENTIKESEEKYRTLVEQASDGIIISDQSLALLEANNMICKMLGYTKEELFKLSVFDITIISKSDPPTRFEELKAGKSILQERRFKRKDGSVFPVEVSSIMMRNGSYLAFARDITKRKKGEVELATAHDRLLFHLENSPLGYIEWDKNLFLKSWSKRIEEIFGWNEKEFIEKHKNGLS